MTDDEHDRDDDLEADAFEARLREALHVRADEVGHPVADRTVLARRGRAREDARRRRAVSLAGVAAVLALIGGAIAWVGAHRSDDEKIQTDRGPGPARCDLPIDAPDSILGLDREGFGLYEAGDGDAEVYGPARLDPKASMAISTYVDPAATDLVGLVIRILSPTTPSFIDLSNPNTDFEGLFLTVLDDGGPIVSAGWRRADGIIVNIDTVGLRSADVLDVAVAIEEAVDESGVAPVVLDDVPQSLPLLASGLIRAPQVWATSWGDGEAVSISVATRDEGDGPWAQAVQSRWEARGGVRWVEVEGRPALLSINDEDSFVLLWRREDDTSVSMSVGGLAPDRWEEVVESLCAFPREAWVGLGARARREAERWRLYPADETVPNTAFPPPTSTPGG